MMVAKQQLSALQVTYCDMTFIFFVAICKRKISFQSKKESENTTNKESSIGANVTFDDFFDTVPRAMKLQKSLPALSPYSPLSSPNCNRSKASSLSPPRACSMGLLESVYAFSPVVGGIRPPGEACKMVLG